MQMQSSPSETVTLYFKSIYKHGDTKNMRVHMQMGRKTVKWTESFNLNKNVHEYVFKEDMQRQN